MFRPECWIEFKPSCLHCKKASIFMLTLLFTYGLCFLLLWRDSMTKATLRIEHLVGACLQFQSINPWFLQEEAERHGAGTVTESFTSLICRERETRPGTNQQHMSSNKVSLPNPSQIVLLTVKQTFIIWACGGYSHSNHQHTWNKN